MATILKIMGFLLCTVGAATALTIEEPLPPNCTVDGVPLYVGTPLVGDVRISHGIVDREKPEWIFVTACSAGKELRTLLLRGDPNVFSEAEDQVLEMVVSAQAFGLSDVANALSDMSVFSEIKTVPSNHCICKFEAS